MVGVIYQDQNIHIHIQMNKTNQLKNSGRQIQT